MESRNPRKIGMGVPHILGLFERGAKIWGCRFFCDTGNPLRYLTIGYLLGVFFRLWIPFFGPYFHFCSEMVPLQGERSGS